MILCRYVNVIFFLGLTLSVICAGCMFKTTQDETAATAVEPPAQTQVDYPGAVYEAGDAAYPDGYYIHTVTLSDESLSIIAKWFTGNLMNWEALAKCNPTINPNRIFLGNTIRIPRVIMTRHTAMTREFVEESQPRPKRQKGTIPSHTEDTTPAETETTPAAVQADPEPVEEDEPLLFGPKGYSRD
jgi:hypothetical protein